MEKMDMRPSKLRQVVIDMLPYSVSDLELLTLQERLGLVPSSLDTLELERAESNQRIELVKPLSNVLMTMSTYSSEALAEYFLLKIDNLMDEDDDDDEDEGGGIPVEFIRKSLINQNKQVIMTATLTIISHLLQSGVLHYAHGADIELLG